LTGGFAASSSQNSLTSVLAGFSQNQRQAVVAVEGVTLWFSLHCYNQPAIGF